MNQHSRKALEDFDRLPNSAHVDVRVVAALRGCAPVTVWRHVKAGILPQPEKTGPNSTRWNVGKLRRHVAGSAHA
ncbi:MAG: transcriptional regulator [Burkholderiales bacterium]|jgi:predicted DNA-binding transcriptional regulator AlpA|nr:transcriptional regulator [Burkholderiales bacterium]